MIHRFWNRDKKNKLSDTQVLSVIIGEVVTEKSFLLSQNKNQKVFRVAFWANKIQIKQALKDIFKIDAVSVNTLVVKGKARRFKGRKGITGAYKKAIVRFSDGQILNQSFNIGEI
ncbi:MULTISPECIES: uL23 family ribosomal protein [Holospora]|uniref:Large ribosomal subunit protein uL23 n=2 Tax=Holospora TaxID=44747 RepID=A0A061JG39_9PROT|nr:MULTISPECIES: 50S ribosomal protein L23 [Holospora]ETZ04755.1 50S ribosomal protein L23 [Holospora undulata HU1]GAJ46019.1 50S ribosomal protein L23 [Holospora elegans E1]